MSSDCVVKRARYVAYVRQVTYVLMVVLSVLFITAEKAWSEPDPFCGEMIMVGENYAPQGWMPAKGQILSITQYTALFAIMYNSFGGDGSTTFALPDMRGRFPIGTGQGVDGSGNKLTNITLGKGTWNKGVVLTQANIPSHSHSLNSADSTIKVFNGSSDLSSPVGAVPANTLAGRDPFFAYTATKPTTSTQVSMAAGSIAGSTNITGSGNPHSNMPPYLGVNYVIAATQCIFPPRP